MSLGQAVAGEGTASSSSLEEEIDKFQFEEEETQVEAIVISEAEKETNEYSCIQIPAPIVTNVENSSDNKAEEMAPKPNQSLRELMKARKKALSPQKANKSKPSPPPPQLSTDLGLKPNPDLRRKRHQEVPEEGEIGPPKGNKQQRQSQDQSSRRSNSVDSRKDPPVAQMRRLSRIWSLKLEVDSVPIAWDSSIRHYHGGHTGHVTETLE